MSKLAAALLLLLILFSAVGLLVDLDSDGLANYEELRHLTNPLSPDTDGDGLNDAYEVEIGSDPRVSWRLGLSPSSVVAALCSRYRARVRPIAEPLAASDPAETAWNVLRWVDENVEYDDAKAASPSPLLDDPLNYRYGEEEGALRGLLPGYGSPPPGVWVRRGLRARDRHGGLSTSTRQ